MAWGATVCFYRCVDYAFPRRTAFESEQGFQKRKKDFDLAALRFSWGDLYDITWTAGGFRAHSHASGTAELFRTSEELNLALRADHGW
jgi:hypothetical protein